MNRSKHGARKACFGDATPAIRPAYAGRVGFIHNERGTVPRGKTLEVAERRAVSLHAEDTLHHNETRAGTRVVAAKRVLEDAQVQMRKNDALAICQPHAVNQAGMICTVGENDVL